MPEGHEPELARSLLPLHWRVGCPCGKWHSDYMHLHLGHFSDHNSARLAWRKHAGA
jgi:hypothetical protein